MNTYYTLLISSNDQLTHRQKGGCKKIVIIYLHTTKFYTNKAHGMSCQFHFNGAKIEEYFERCLTRRIFLKVPNYRIHLSWLTMTHSCKQHSRHPVLQYGSSGCRVICNLTTIWTHPYQSVTYHTIPAYQNAPSATSTFTTLIHGQFFMTF